MPIYFWNDRRNKKYINSYFNKFKNVWTHGDYILITKYGGVQIFGRSDATLNPGGVRIGTSEIYQVLESIDYIDDSLLVGQKWKDDERIVLFLKLFNSNLISDKIITEVKEVIKKHCSPRHIPNKIIQIQDIPYTVNGKKVEIAVKNIIHGINPDNKSALANPESLEFYKNIRDLQI